jgi:hypothetical protein
MNKTALFVLAAIIILGGIWVVAKRNDTPTPVGNNASSTAPTSTAGTSATPGVTRVVLAETSAGNRAVIQSAQLSDPGYIVVYRSTVDGDTEIVGHSNLLSAGAYSNLGITLDSAVSADQTLTAVLHKDDGDGKFEVPGPDSFMGSGNARIISDVDVVGSPKSEESPLLESQVEAYLNDALQASTTSN